MALLAVGYATAAVGQTPLASGQLRILGVQLVVCGQSTCSPSGPATQTVPKNQATGFRTALVDPANPTPSVADPSLTSLVVKGELSGPGICQGAQAGTPAPPCAATGVITLSTPAGQLLPIPALLATGNYVVDDLRLEDGNGNMLMPAMPAMATLDVIEQVIVTSVSTQTLSLDELQDRGIVLDSANFTAYQFTFGIGTESNQVPISFDVAFSKDPETSSTGAGAPEVPVVIPGLQVPNLDVRGLLLQTPQLQENVQLPPIPAVIVIPGNIAFLHQFFQVIVLVSNVAPAGSQLVVTGATATLVLPPGADGIPDTTDDPLAFAKTQGSGTSGQGSGEGTVDLKNKTTGAADFGPGEDANGEVDVEGRLEGTYQIDVTINAQLLGLPVSPVPLSGKASGTVLVRNPNFALTFNHPDVVRAGETYALYVTIHNTGGADANCVTMTLNAKDISGATLVGAKAVASAQAGTPAPPNPCPAPSGPGAVVVPTIKQNDAQTVEYDLIARKNGQVTATGFTSSDPLNAGFILRTGIGDDNIPLSPDSLVLAPYVNDLPPDFFATAMRVLGLAHSVATAPAGATIGIEDRISRALVDQRAQQLTEAGLRIRIGDVTVTSIGDVMLGWLGNAGGPSTITSTITNFDPGFDEVMRETDAGHDLETAWGAVIEGAQAGTPAATIIDYQQQFAEVEKYRPSFVSVAVAGDLSIALDDDKGRHTAGVGATGRSPLRGIPGAALLGLTSGELAVIGNSSQSAFYDVTITGTGTSIGIVWPDATGKLQQAVFSGVALAEGETATLHIVPGAGGTPALQVPNNQQLTTNSLSFDANAGPQVVGVRQIPESDPLERGRVVAVLYDRDADTSGLHAVLNYADGQGPLAMGPTQNSVKRTKVLPSNRIVLINFFSSVSRFFQYTLTSSGVMSPGGTGQVPASDTHVVVPDFTTPPGGIVSGYVRKGTGEAIALVPVELVEQFVNDVTGLPMSVITGQTVTDATGYYRFDFVGQDGVGPFDVSAQDPDTGQHAQRFASIAMEHQEMRIDLLMLGLGRVTGSVIDAATGMPVANATVHVLSHTDESQVDVTSDANGNFSANNVAVGNLLVSADVTDPDSGAVSTGSVAATLDTAGATATVTVLVFAGTGSVEGTVYEAVSDQRSAL
jgi:hypothetical protein